MALSCFGFVKVVLLGLCIATALNFGARKGLDYLRLATPTSYDFVCGWVAGTLLTPAFIWSSRVLTKYILNQASPLGRGGGIYGLEHAKLNLEAPPKSMWMNLGYWENEVHFPAACSALLREVLKAAGFLADDGSVRSPSVRCGIRIVDVGFGCGDQSLFLTSLRRPMDHNSMYLRDEASSPLFDSYVGISIVKSQVDFAQVRMSQHIPLNRISQQDIQLFCEDAANPDSWTPNLHAATVAPRASLPQGAGPSVENTWVLGLDCLYHFKPCRQPFFEHARSELRASIMAFDLLISDTASSFDKILLRGVCTLTSTPFSNFLTKTEYENGLVAAGYKRGEIEIRDVSEHVFAGIATFIRNKELQLSNFGIGIGAFKVAGWIFGWWAKTGIVRGVIVVARQSDGS